MKKLVWIFILLGHQTLFALSLDEYLNLVKKKNRIYSATDLSVQAADDKKEAGDLVLAPSISAGYSVAEDKTSPSTVAPLRRLTEYNLGVSKKFSTGTSVGVNAKADQYENFDDANGRSVSEFSTGTVGVSLQQSLWKDFFGKATRLRHERENYVSLSEKLALDLKQKSLLLEAESSFWDYAVALEDLKLKKENLERARKLEKWTSNRLNNGISDRSDLMNVRALSSVRELEMQTADDSLKTEEVRFRQNLDLTETEPTPIINANMTDARPYIKEMSQRKNVISIEAYLAVFEAKTKKMISEEVRDTLRPELNLLGTYNTSSYDPYLKDAMNSITNSNRPRTFIGLNFVWLFDTDAKRSQLSFTVKEAQAAQYTAEKKKEEGQKKWQEYLRKYEVTQETVKTLEKIANYQRERAKAEQDKFSKGRTITSNVVNAETDSAEAEAKYLKAKAGLRKLEATTQLYTTIQE